MGLTAAGINHISQLVIGQGTPFNALNAELGVGDGQEPFDVSQTDLQGENTLRKQMDSGWPRVEAPKVTFRSVFNKEEANFGWNEWAVFNADTGGVMLNRVVEPNGTKQDNQTWILEVDITFSIGE